VKKSEIAKILTIASALDNWVTVDEPRILAWELALIPAVTYEFAVDALGRHYSHSAKSIMPVHINDPWRAQRADLLARMSITTAIQPREFNPPTEEYVKMREFLSQFGRKYV